MCRDPHDAIFSSRGGARPFAEQGSGGPIVKAAVAGAFLLFERVQTAIMIWSGLFGVISFELFGPPVRCGGPRPR